MIQLGTVMTHPEHRGLGLSRLLLEAILAEYQGKAELIYLFANRSVLEFYPKFGFEAQPEYVYRYTNPSQPTPLQRLALSEPAAADTLLRCYAHGNPLSALYSVGNRGLLRFHTAFLEEQIYFVPEYDAVMIAKVEGHTMTLYELLGKEFPSSALGQLMPQGVTELRLGFSPKDTTGLNCRLLEEADNTLFVLQGGEPIFQKDRLCFPLLSHA